MDLADRLRALIERDFEGNLNRAAKAWDVPQPTLYRYVNRVTDTPKAHTLQRIAKFYEGTVDWLLDGVGASPLNAEYPIAAYRVWERLVKSLGLPEEVERLVLPLPSRVQAAHSALCNWGMFPDWEWTEEAKKRAEAPREAAWRAGAMEYDAWGVWLRALIAAYGEVAVRGKLVSEVDRLRIGYQPFAMFLQMTDRLPADSRVVYDREFRPPGQHFAYHFVNLPSQPPLNAAGSRRRSE
jgi:hypothetical protein